MKVKGIHRIRKRMKDGRDRYYYYTYRGGAMFWIADNQPEKQPFSTRFASAYREALKEKPQQGAAPYGTIKRLIEDFEESAAFLNVSPSLQKSYRKGFGAILNDKDLSKAKLSYFSDMRMRAVVKRWHHSYGDTPRAADLHLTTLKRLLNWAFDEGMIKSHVVSKIKALHKANRSEVIWEPDELEAFYACCSTEHLAKAVEFAALSGLRLGDLVTLPISADKGGWIEWVTAKRGKEVFIPVTGQMRSVLNWFQAERQKRPFVGQPIVINSRYRKWTPSGLSTSFQKARNACGVNKRFHDLRGTAATNYKLAKFKDEDIAGFLGWDEKSVKSIITRYVDRKRIMKAAVIRLDEHR